MTKESASRKKKILNIIVREYIDTAVPVASENLQRNYALNVSSATIRNDMANLEEEGYITRPHTSAGCVPLNKGYRHYVESLSEGAELPADEQRQIERLFKEASDEVDRWLRLAASLMSRLVRNAVVVTYPRASQSKLKHVELVSLHDFLGMLILVLSEASIRQHLLNFSKPISQDQLTRIANKLNSKFSGMTRSAILSKRTELSVEEKQVAEAITGIMEAEDTADPDQSHMEGLRLMLTQPEFTRQERMLRVLELLEARGWLKSVFGAGIAQDGISVVIGEESGIEALKDMSLVFGRYGVPQRLGGSIGIIGPTRMDYARAISSVGYVSEILSQMVGEVCSDE